MGDMGDMSKNGC